MSTLTKGATLSHLFYLPLYFMQRTVAQFRVETSQSAGLDRKMAGYLKELGYGA
ncbi:hypothetical protein [Endozoicomonas sp. Mp262]|uniref:hypothetical protein n=1 Tax=Endozoicomonas sp. Mp262 TaxID=2919499 RepID=UPI0021DAA8DA